MKSKLLNKRISAVSLMDSMDDKERYYVAASYQYPALEEPEAEGNSITVTQDTAAETFLTEGLSKVLKISPISLAKWFINIYINQDI